MSVLFLCEIIPSITFLTVHLIDFSSFTGYLFLENGQVLHYYLTVYIPTFFHTILLFSMHRYSFCKLSPGTTCGKTHRVTFY